jgi:regulatory protein
VEFRHNKSYTLEEALSRMEQYCAYRERCHREVVAKLREMRMIPEAIDTIVVRLIETDFLNEMRFARAFVQGKFRQKGWGKMRLQRELKQREISEYLVRKALADIDEADYQERFEAMAEKQWEALKNETHPLKRKKKFVDYFTYRGWEPDRIYDRLQILSGK